MTGTSKPQGQTRAAVVALPRAHALARFLPSGRSLAVAFALVAAAAGAYALARGTSMFALRRIEVTGAPPSVAAHVRTALGSLEGTSLLGLDGATVERRLAELPDVASASYDRAFPHALHVVVRPEIPVGVLRLGRDAWVVSARARVIARSSPGALPGAPRVWLAPGTQVEVGQTLAGPTTVRAVRALATLLRAPGRIRVGNVRSTAGEFTLLLRSGIEVRLGNGRDLALKLAVTERILPRVAGPGYLDVSAPERPVFGSKSQPAG